MSDLKPLPERPTLTLPPASYPARKPAPPQVPPPATKPESAPKAKASEEPDFDFLFAARRDRAPVCFELVNGKELTGTVIALGRYSLSVLVEGSERPEIIFKHALMRMRRAPLASENGSG